MRRLAAGIGVGLLAAALLAGRPGLTAQEKKHYQDAMALHKNAKAFVDAFNKGDAKAVAAFWIVEGDYVDQEGRHLKGRKAIEEALKGFFAENKGAKLQINKPMRRFVTAALAI